MWSAKCGVSPFIRFRISGANFIRAFKKRGTRDTCRDRRLDPAEPVGAARGTHIFLKNTVQTVQRCASARRCSLVLKLARWMPAQLATPSSRPLALRRTARRGPSALPHSLCRKSDFRKHSTYAPPLIVWRLFSLCETDPSATTRRATRAKKLCTAQVTWTRPMSSTSRRSKV